MLASVLSLVEADDPFRIFRVIITHLVGITFILYFNAGRSTFGDEFVTTFAIRTIYIGVGITSVAFVAHTAGVLTLGGYRYKGFFDNAIQNAMVAATGLPFLYCHTLLSNVSARRKLISYGMILASMLIILSSGAKFALGMAPIFCTMIWMLTSVRLGNASSMMRSILVGLVFLMVCIFVFANLEQWNPILFAKINSILSSDDVTQYQSIQSRMELWNESIRLFLQHPLTGVGAGSLVLGLSHSHNVFLDYARGLGIFGLAGMLLISLLVVGCALSSILRFMASPSDRTITIMGLHLSTMLYLLLNQLSDSFGVATSPIFWIMFAGGIVLQGVRRQVPAHLRVPASGVTGISGQFAEPRKVTVRRAGIAPASAR